MKNLTNYITEKTEQSKETIEVSVKGKFGYMVYDPNSGTVFVFSMDRPQDIIDEYGYKDEEAWRLAKLNVGQTYCDDSGSLNTRIW